MLDHLDDLDADFLAIYGIDLRDPDADLSAEMFFARAFRLFSYRGAMREALQAEQEANEPAPAPHAAAPRPVTPRPAVGEPSGVDAEGTEWVSLDDMRQRFPDLF